MRLSEERVMFLARKMANRMVEEGAVDPKTRRENLATLIAQVIIQDLQVEEQIDGEARDQMGKRKHLPPQGSAEYEAIFQQAKRDIAAKRGYPL